MSSHRLLPKVFRNEQNIQLSYEVPHRIYDAAKYPTLAPNGSSILIYAHENGIRFIWRGGRAFKSNADTTPAEKPRTNGSSDAVMIIDSDEEDTEGAAPPFQDKPIFEDDEAEIDPAKPYTPIIQYLDLHFSTAALRIAVPPVSVSTLGATPQILKDKAVIVAAFADHVVRVITLPLTPPSPASKSRQELISNFTAGNAGNGKWGEEIIELTGYSMAPDGLSITFANKKSSTESNGNTQKKPRAVSKPPAEEDWQALIASHSREVTGLLLVHKIPLVERRKDGIVHYSLSKDHTAPAQTQYLSSPATTLTFNPSISQSTQILLADRTGACRIYDCQPSVDGSNTEFSSSATGLWLLTMYPGFQSSKAETTNTLSATALANFGRKSVIDAKWAMSGKAVIVLLADGEWGLWDIEGNGPNFSKSILSRQAVKGGATTAFSITGWVDGPPLKSSSRGAATQSSTSKFAPMTPGARRTAEPILFNGRSGQGFSRGQISVTSLPVVSTTSPVEECVVFWLEDSYSVVPNLRSYWEAQARKNGGGTGNLFAGSSSGSRTIRLDNINLQGEMCGGIVQYARGTTTPKSILPTELLVVGEHRFIILSDATPEPRSHRKHVSLQDQNKPVPSGDLDVVGIDQALAQMENRSSKAKHKMGFLV